MSSRINREIVARLPKGIGDAVDNIGKLRDKARADDLEIEIQDPSQTLRSSGVLQNKQFDDVDLPSTPNEPVSHHTMNSDNRNDTLFSRRQGRIRWVAQMSEFWPLDSLASLKEEEFHAILNGDVTPSSRRFAGISGSTIPTAPTLHVMPPLAPPSSSGRLFLVGSGPGHPMLLTLAASKILQSADLVLSDKLVPEAVLDTIPKSE